MGDDDLIPVRLVPKTTTGNSIARTRYAIEPGKSAQFAPDPGRAKEAATVAAKLELQNVRITRTHAVELAVPMHRIQDLFRVEARRVDRTKGKFDHRILAEPTFLLPSAQLKVPPEFDSTIDFAYVPRPPEFYSECFVPPNPHVFSLRLADVRNALNASHLHRRGITGRNVRVAMADTGFATHPYYERLGFTITRVAMAEGSDPSHDPSGHGTGESGNVLALAPDSDFVGVKHTGHSAEALEACLDQDPAIIVSSWGWDEDHQSMIHLEAADPGLFLEFRDIERVIAKAIESGIIVIFAAGNGQQAFPACIPSVIAVGGVTVRPDGSLAASSFASSFRSSLYPGRAVPDICGVVGEDSGPPMSGHIMLPVPSGSDFEGTNLPGGTAARGWGVFSGTSAAAPQIAGLIALLKCVRANLDQQAAKALLEASATDVTTGVSALGDAAAPGRDLATGAGLADGHGALRRMH